ncbi:MAG: hypothetical protein KC621_33890, partial [Myxococcales bacterium]|nr:hypothetical protein [Myxococcales bacterium]
MARPDPNDDLRKKQLPQQEQEEEQELEQQQEQQQEQQRDAAQDQLGNQEIATLLGLGGVKAGEAGQGTDVILRNESGDKDGADYGGDDAPSDAPIEMEDLVRSWNPGIRRGQDAPKFVETMPTGELAEEDEELLRELDEDPVEPLEDLPDGIGLSPQVVLRDPTPLVRAAVRLSDGSLLHRTWAHLLVPAAPALVDPHGRLVTTRARVLALTQLLVLDA